MFGTVASLRGFMGVPGQILVNQNINPNPQDGLYDLSVQFISIFFSNRFSILEIIFLCILI